MNVLGINAYHGDAAACLLVDGKLEVAIEEERLRRVKHWAGFPSRAIRACLAHAGLDPRDLDHVAVGRAPAANAVRKVSYALRHHPPLSLLRDRWANRRRVRDLGTELASSFDLDRGLLRASVHWVEHHVAHVASAFYCSPYDEAVCVSLDGFGDFASALWAVGRGTKLHVRQRVHFPHSLGAFYTAGTQYLGFPHFGDEYKVMGLAPYGTPRAVPALREAIVLEPRGRFRLDLDFFRHTRHVVDTRWDGGAPAMDAYFSELWTRRFGPPRRPDEPIEPRHGDLAYALQHLAEVVWFHALSRAAELDSARRLCLAGGCAANAVVNGKVLAATPFDELYVPPAVGDAGTAVGAALYVWHAVLGRPRRAELADAFLGLPASPSAVRSALAAAGVDHEWHEDEEQRVRIAANALAQGEIVGWFQDRDEWGPRALGNRSILADPRRASTRDALNRRIKRREGFRPFAPAVVQERAGEFFDSDGPSPFMNRVVPIRAGWRERLPAVTHVDGTARLQTVARATQPRFHRLLEAFGQRSGLPVLLNTSFNENEPIVHTPAEALDCFRRTGMDLLILGPAVLRRPDGNSRA